MALRDDEDLKGEKLLWIVALAMLVGALMTAYVGWTIATGGAEAEAVSESPR